jgi:hypothetical protein
MVTFEGWALAVTDVVEGKLGMKNVSSELYEDHAIWTSKANRGIARPDGNSRTVAVVFDKGRGHAYSLDDSPDGAGAEITGRLLGLG